MSALELMLPIIMGWVVGAIAAKIHNYLDYKKAYPTASFWDYTRM